MKTLTHDSTKCSPGRVRAFAYCAGAYGAAAGAALLTGVLLGPRHPLITAAAADLAATCVVFLFSAAAGNSSIYDPYWSAAPVPIALYFVLQSPDGFTVRKALVFTLVSVWSLRLTWNWASGWRGLSHEDWRYVRFRELCGRWYWPVSFAGIHLMPTFCVFLGCLSLYPVLALPSGALNLADAAAVAVTAAAIFIESEADRELRRFIAVRKTREETLMTGLWGVSRHPNYFGEILFWWGIFLFALFSPGTPGWPAVGPLAITALFIFISIPLTERRLLLRHPGYGHVMKTVSPLVPWVRRKEG